MCLLVRYQRILRGLTSSVFVLLLLWSLTRAWGHTESDFPSYYTAAHLLLKRTPLRSFYDMAQFQQQMDSIVIPNRLGGYIPQTPLTMLPFVPLARLPMNNAKQLWLLVDIILLGGTVWVLTRLTEIEISGIIGLFVLGFGSLYTNLMLGQYYILILFLLTCATFLVHSSRDFGGGFLLGLICCLKLITAPFLLYFAWKSQPKVLGGICTALVLGVLVTVVFFGWADLAYYLGQILPRSLEGETLDPFNPANGTVTTLLRRMLVFDPELNPNPVLNAPSLFFFFRAAFTVSILAISLLLSFERTNGAKQDYAAFLVVLIIISPNTASYTFVLLLLPVALKLKNTTTWHRVVLLLCYTLLAAPMRPAWSWLFPKVWILIGMFWLALTPHKNPYRVRTRLGVVSAAVLLTLFVTGFETAVHAKEAHQQWTPIVERGAIFSSSPIPIREGTVYLAILHGRYTLAIHNGQDSRPFALEGDAFNPVLLPSKELIGFESFRSGTKSQLALDPRTGAILSLSDADLKGWSGNSRSPDGKWIVSERRSAMGTQIYLVDPTGNVPSIEVTDGPCNSFAPAWDRDSQSVVFASDCGRGVGMPALYRARLQAMLALAKK